MDGEIGPHHSVSLPLAHPGRAEKMGHDERITGGVVRGPVQKRKFIRALEPFPKAMDAGDDLSGPGREHQLGGEFETLF